MKPIKSNLRLILVNMEITLKSLSARPTWLIDNTIVPLIFTLVALFLFYLAELDNFIPYAVFGSGIAGMWATTLFGAGNSLRVERILGTLEYLLICPTGLWKNLFGRALAFSLLGLTVFGQALTLAVFVFNVPIIVSNSVVFVVAFLLTVVSFVALGMLLAPLFIIARSAPNLMNSLETLILVFCGVTYPVSVLPPLFQIVSYTLAPTWGMEALRFTVSSICLDGIVLRNVVIIICLTFIYLIFSKKLVNSIEKKVRLKGGLVRI